MPNNYHDETLCCLLFDFGKEKTNMATIFFEVKNKRSDPNIKLPFVKKYG